MDCFPKWVPSRIAQRVQEYEEKIRIGEKWPTLECEYEIWRRLATRPEMESVWNFIVSTVGTESLHTNDGLFGVVNRAVRNFNSGPKFSTADYKREMLEIAKLAETLSNKLQKFCDAAPTYNPFTFLMVLSDGERKLVAERLGKTYDDYCGKVRFAFYLDYCLPAFDTQIKGIASQAKIESIKQTHKLQLPRKVKSENLFRTYLISAIGNYFCLRCLDYSSARLATFCCVALDDANITADLAGKIYSLDDECRAMVDAQRAYIKQED